MVYERRFRERNLIQEPRNAMNLSCVGKSNNTYSFSIKFITENPRYRWFLARSRSPAEESKMHPLGPI